MVNAFLAIVVLAVLSVLSGNAEARRRRGRGYSRRRYSRRENGRGIISIGGICPVTKEKGGCATPDFAGPEFGDNSKTTGMMHAKLSRTGGVKLQIIVDKLPKPNLVLTAWVVWVPGGVTVPKIFEIANHAAPCAPYTAKFGAGFGIEPNELIYRDHNTARLHVGLNFNPTLVNQGALTRETFSFQKDVVGIQSTKFAQYKAGDVYIPTSSSYLRKYDNKTGYELLDKYGNPEVVNSPVKALGVEVIAHTDKTTHGISQGVGGTDHYAVIFFPFGDKVLK